MIFSKRMELAYDGGKPSALAPFEATGRACLAFPRQYTDHYLAMFKSGISIQRSAKPNFATTQAQSVLQTATIDLSKNIPEEKRPPTPHVCSPYLGYELRCGETFHARHSRRSQPVPT